MANRITIVLLTSLLLAGCAPRPQASNVALENKISEPKIYSCPDPGPFQLKEIEMPDHSKAEFWQARGEVGQFGGTLVVAGIGNGPKTFNFWAAGDAEGAGIGALMWESLLDVDPWTGKPYPRLASKIEMSPNKCDYTMTLRKGLLWSDGKPISADDVVFTYNEIIGKKLGHHGASLHDVMSVYGQFPTVSKVDDLTIKFHTKVPFVPFLFSVGGCPIAPKHALEAVVKKGATAFESYWSSNCNPNDIVVSGRFKLARYVPAQRAEFVRNDKFAMVDKLGRQLPYLDRLIYAIVPDQNTMALKFYANELNLLDVHCIRGADAALMKQRSQTGNFTMYNLGPDDGTTFFLVNMCRRKNPETGKYYIDPIKQRWFNNIYFRQAISHAINRQAMVTNILKGVGVPLFTSESCASVYFNKDLHPYPQDLNLAAELLTKGGFVNRNGHLYDDQNHLVEFTLHTNAGNTAREACATMIVNDLQKLGIKVNFQPLDFNTIVNKMESNLDWEAVVMGLTGSKLDPYGGANVWKSDGRLHLFDQRLPNKSGNIVATDARGWEKRIDQIFDLAATTFDETKRKAYYDEYQKIAYDEQPCIYLYSTLDLSAFRNNIGNYMPTPLGVGYTPIGSMHNLEEIYFKHKEAKR